MATLTGRMRYDARIVGGWWRGYRTILVLQVEETVRVLGEIDGYGSSDPDYDHTYWRDADLGDLLKWGTPSPMEKRNECSAPTIPRGPDVGGSTEGLGPCPSIDESGSPDGLPRYLRSYQPTDGGSPHGAVTKRYPSTEPNP